MNQQFIFRGTVPDDGTGDTPYVEAGKTNENFREVYSHLANRNNPHGTTPSQIGTYSAEEIDQRLGGITEAVAKGLLTAMSVTPATLIAATQVALEIVGDQRSIFAPGPFAVVSRVATAADYAVVRSITYDRTTGTYTFEVVTVGGNPGPHDDWIIAAVAGSTLAQMQLLAQGQATSDAIAQVEATVVAARDLALTARDAAAEARDQAEASRTAAESATNKAEAAATVAVDATSTTSANAAAAAASATQADQSAQAAAAAAASVDTSTFVAKDGSRPLTGQQTFAAPAAGRASAVLPSGTDPSAPIEGALWNAGGTLKGFLGGVTRVFAFLGIAQSWGALQTFLTGVVLTNLGSDPASPANGQLWTRTGSGLFGYLNGAAQRILDGSLFATTAEATAGTATDRVMNPARTKEAIVALAPAEGPATDLFWFGDGSDGDLVASSGTTTLTRDTFYNNVTLSGSAVLDTAGYRLFVKGVLDISGLTSGYVGRTIATVTGRTPGGALVAGTLGGGVAGGAGGLGGSPSGVTPGSPGASAAVAAGGSSTGNGGAGGSGQSGSAGGGSTANSVAGALARLRRVTIEGISSLSLVQGGGVGGVGGSGGYGGVDGTVPGGNGGAGGASGGVVFVFARTINRSASTVAGAIRARGGDGASGLAPSNLASNPGGGGGGAGGAGGWVQVVCRFLTGVAATNTLDARGGNGGAGGNGFGSGTAGRGGGAGFGGFACLFNLSAGTATCLLGPQASTQPTGQAGEAAAATFVSL